MVTLGHAVKLTPMHHQACLNEGVVLISWECVVASVLVEPACGGQHEHRCGPILLAVHSAVPGREGE